MIKRKEQHWTRSFRYQSASLVPASAYNIDVMFKPNESLLKFEWKLFKVPVISLVLVCRVAVKPRQSFHGAVDSAWPKQNKSSHITRTKIKNQSVKALSQIFHTSQKQPRTKSFNALSFRQNACIVFVFDTTMVSRSFRLTHTRSPTNPPRQLKFRRSKLSINNKQNRIFRRHGHATSGVYPIRTCIRKITLTRIPPMMMMVQEIFCHSNLARCRLQQML